MYEAVHGLPMQPSKPEDDVINVDSPTTITHNYPPPSPLLVAQPVQPSSIGTLAKLGIGAALVATGAGIVPGLSMVASAVKDRLTVQQPATTTAQPQTPPNFYGLELVPPK